MKKLLVTVLFIAISSTNLLAEKVLYTCDSAKSELYDLIKLSSNKGYKNDSLSLKIILKNKKVYINSGSSESELIYLEGRNSQFLEKVSGGHYVLYTIHTASKIMTIQKSYDLAGPIMVNMTLQCR